jgi:ATP-dependent Clp protease adaptor protein ClpS
MKLEREMNINMQTETLEQEQVVETLVNEQNLIVFNDDFNTFDHVIESLIKVCEHDVVQAEQCTTLIHYKGKCDVKRGDYDTLEVMCTALLERGISAEIH